MRPDQDEMLEQLYYANYKKLLLYALSASQSQVSAPELVQDTFHEAVLHIDTLMTHANPGGWLMQTLKYKMKENDKARQRDAKYLLSLDT